MEKDEKITFYQQIKYFIKATHSSTQKKGMWLAQRLPKSWVKNKRHDPNVEKPALATSSVT